MGSELPGAERWMIFGVRAFYECPPQASNNKHRALMEGLLFFLCMYFVLFPLYLDSFA